MFKEIKKWLIKKLGGVMIESPANREYLITALNEKGETVPWTTINPNKRKSKYNMIKYYNLYEGETLLLTFPVKSKL